MNGYACHYKKNGHNLPFSSTQRSEFHFGLVAITRIATRLLLVAMHTVASAWRFRVWRSCSPKIYYVDGLNSAIGDLRVL